jgi:hypothetical protein
MLPRIPSLTTIALCACALLSTACERKGDHTDPPTSESSASGGSDGSGTQCSAGGPSVSVNILGREAGNDMPSDELGALLGWIGGFAQPCRQAAPEAPRFTLQIELGEGDLPPSLVIGDTDTLPGLTTCLQETFAKAPPPPVRSMTVEIVIPWGCPTLGAGFQAEGKKTEAAAAEPAP